MLNLFKKKTKKEDVSKNQANDYGEIDILNKEDLYQSGLTRVLDFIAPAALGVSSSYLQIGEVYCRTIFVSVYPRILSIGWMGRMITLDLPLDISFFAHPVNTAKVLKNLRKKVTQIQSQINIENEKGLTRNPELEMAYRNV